MSRMRIDNKDIHDAHIFEILLDNFIDIIHSVDDEGNIIFTNHKAEELLGYTRDELLKMNVREIYADEILKKVDAGFSELKERGDFAVESLLKAKDGTLIPVEIRSFSIYNDDGEFLRTFSILRDIRDIKELQNNLIHAGRLAAVGEMSAGVAHDIKNPLTAILLANQMVINQLQKADDEQVPAERLLSFANDVQRASKSIQKLVDHLRNFSRGVAEQRETVDLHTALADALFITANKANKVAADVRNTVEPGRHYTYGAPNQIEQVFVNLVSNACDAMEGRDTRVLTISIDEALDNGEEFWKCEISDTGVGISEDDIDTVFDSFFTTKEKGAGTGLGLSIARGIIQEHGGDISVASTPGEGTTFSVMLLKKKLPDDPSPAGD